MSDGPTGWQAAVPGGLAGCSRPPAETFDVALLDLDGVVYIGDAPVPHAAEALRVAEASGMRRAYVTNNARRTAAAVAAALGTVGVVAAAEDVVTSAHAVARLLSEQVPVGAAVLVCGAEGLRDAVADAGFEPVAAADPCPAAVALGYDPTLTYARLAEAALAVQRGALFIAANRDATVPSARGPLPGMGAITAFVATASGRAPQVAGKPERTLHAESIARSGAKCPLVVGDRLDTDIEGARRAGTPAMLVLTGVTDLAALAAAAPTCRPDLLASDLRGLNAPHPPAAGGCCGEAHATWDATTGRVGIDADAGAGDDVLRALVTAAWAASDAGGEVTGLDGTGEL